MGRALAGGRARPGPGWLRNASGSPRDLTRIALLAFLVALPSAAFLHSPSSAAAPPSASTSGAAPLDASPASSLATVACTNHSPPPCGASRTATGTLVWTNLTAGLALSPTARSGAASAFDPQLGVTLLFGGQAPDGSALGDLWAFDQGAWTSIEGAAQPGPGPRWGSAMAYDSVDGWAVLFGGRNASAAFSDTWALNATGWHLLRPILAPTARAFPVAAYDPRDTGILLTGGSPGLSTTSVLNDTWLLHGGAWTNLSTEFPGPTPALGAAGTYDARDGYFLRTGGAQPLSSGGGPGGLWAFDDAGWTNLSAAAPGALLGRTGASITFDPGTGKVLVFGGSDLTTIGPPSFASETWQYSAGVWTDLTASLGLSPPGRQAATLAVEPGSTGLVLFGGDTGSSSKTYGDTWRLTAQVLEVTLTATPTAGTAPLNVSFSLSVAGGSPPYSPTWQFGDAQGASGTFHLNHVYGVAGNFTASVSVTDASGNLFSESLPIAVLTAWEGAHQWADVGRSLTSAPSPRASPQLAYDPGLKAVILFGGRSSSGTPLADTWEFVNNLWINLTPSLAASPAARWGGALVYDSIDATLILFGGTTGSIALNDTWTYDGTGWRPLFPSSAPSPRAFAQSAFDVSDGYLLLFGGGGIGSAGLAGPGESDTWEFRAGSWQNISSQLTIAPPPTLGGSMVWDAGDALIVLVGGSAIAAVGQPGTCYPSSATWTFVGGQWTAAPAGSGPSGRLLAGAAFDQSDRLLLLFGGARSAANLCRITSETWSYIGASWTNLTGAIQAPPRARDSPGMTFDGAEGVALMFGGSAGGLLLNDTWIYPTPVNGTAGSSSGNSSSGGGTGGGTGGGGGGSGSGSNGSGSGTSTPPPPPFTVGYSLSSVTSAGPLTVTFVATASGGVPPFTFNWYFGDSTPTVNGSPVVHRYLVPGSYEPVLTASDSTGAVVIRLLASITIAPSSNTGVTVPNPPSSGPSLGTLSVDFLGVGSVLLAALVAVYGRKEWRLSRLGGNHEEPLS